MDTALHIFLLALAAIFPIVNPPGSAPCLPRHDKQRDPRGPPSRHLARCAKRVLRPCQRVVARFADLRLVRHFDTGPSRAGGFIFAVAGWKLLSEGSQKELEATADGHHHQADRLDLAFYPLTLPLTTGPGTIAVVISLGLSQGTFASSTDEAVFVLASLCAILVIAAAIYLCSPTPTASSVCWDRVAPISPCRSFSSASASRFSGPAEASCCIP
jgi:multiple antibiotic resistance protein